jgi:DNA repair protein RecO (recombination protein O)
VSRKRVYGTEAIVIRRRDQGEADRVITLCTPMGKLEGIAKGVRKARSRNKGHLELFVHSKVSLARSRSSWDVITQADTVSPHQPLRGDLVRGTYARYAAELYDRFVAAGEGGPALFELMQRMMGYLCQEERLSLLTRAFEQRLLTMVGFRTELDRCVGERAGGLCNRELVGGRSEPFGLDPERGGALCPDCFRAGQALRNVIPLSPAALILMKACQRESFTHLRRRSTSEPLMAELERAARHYITYHLERDVRSGAFLRQLQREGRTDPAQRG